MTIIIIVSKEMMIMIVMMMYKENCHFTIISIHYMLVVRVLLFLLDC